MAFKLGTLSAPSGLRVDNNIETNESIRRGPMGYSDGSIPLQTGMTPGDPVGADRVHGR
jgi:hypothetical protein